MPKELETFEYWVELPPEMKNEVIKSLELKERSNLRCTAKTEMLLVDKAKFSLMSLSVIVNEHTTDVRVAEMSGSEQNLVFRGTDFKKKVRHILSYLFQHCSRFGEIKIRRSDDILTEDCFLFPIKTRKLSLTDCSDSQVLLFAKKCDADCVDVAEITHRHERFSVYVLSSILKLNPTKLINIHYQHSEMLAFGAAVLWMDEDVADYARIIFSSQTRNELENFRFTFEDETVSQVDGKMIRFTTRTESKHFVLFFKERIDGLNYYILGVVPSHLNDSEISSALDLDENLEKYMPSRDT